MKGSPVTTGKFIIAFELPVYTPLALHTMFIASRIFRHPRDLPVSPLPPPPPTLHSAMLKTYNPLFYPTALFS